MSLLQALTHVKDIELRLNGIIKTKRKQQGLPLSIEGQVNHLILVCISFYRKHCFLKISENNFFKQWI